jgi:hypothetical protein
MKRTCRVHEGAWGGCGIDGYRVKFSDPLFTVCLVVRHRWVMSCSYRLVARVKLITARTAYIFGFQSSVSVVNLPPSRRGRLSSPLYTPKIFRCSLHLAQWKMKCSLDSAASPHSQRFVSAALTLCRYPFSGVMPVQSYAKTLACLLLRSSYMRRVWPWQANWHPVETDIVGRMLRTRFPDLVPNLEALPNVAGVAQNPHKARHRWFLGGLEFYNSL